MAKMCKHPGCSEFIVRQNVYCDKHAGQYGKVLAERETVRVKRRGTTAERGYSGRWVRYRKYYLQAHPLCACGCGKLATDIDHIKPVKGPFDPLFWDESNHQALAHECHSRKTAKEDGGFGNNKRQ